MANRCGPRERVSRVGLRTVPPGVPSQIGRYIAVWVWWCFQCPMVSVQPVDGTVTGMWTELLTGAWPSLGSTVTVMSTE
jgi:hypothetical protein